MSKQITRQPTKQQRRRDRREEERRREEEQKRRQRNRGIIIGSVIAAVVLITAGIIFAYISKNNTSLRTPTTVFAAYPPIDKNVECDSGEQLVYHIHAHVSIYINGQQSNIPANTGIASDGTCLYWLHTHDTSGVIHMESPDNRTFIFGNFLDEWEQVFPQLGYPSQLDLSSGWTVYVNGSLYKGNFRNIPLQAHTLITMAYNSPNVKADTSYPWNGL